MTDYAKRFRRKYDDGDISMEEFLWQVMNTAEENARKSENRRQYTPHDRHIVKRATIALIELGKKGELVDGKAIKDREGFQYYKGYGLWPWEERNANVVGKQIGPKFKVKEEFYYALAKITKVIR